MEKQSKIIIVDDDPDFVAATKTILESKLYKVIVASNAEEGMGKVKEENPDLIILDVMMANRDSGFDVCRQLKKDPQCKHIPILMLTGIREKTGFDFKREAGDETYLPVDDYEPKPIKPHELLKRVESLLGRA